MVISNLFIYFILSFKFSSSTLAKKGPIYEPKREKSVLSEPQNIKSDNFDFHDAIKNHDKYDQNSTKSHKINYLGYITPWNKHGKTYALQQAAKFSFISPVWLTVKPNDISLLSIEDDGNIDHEWMENLKEKNPQIKILPRVHILKDVFLETNEKPSDTINKLIEDTSRIIKENKFDGITFECPSLFFQNMSSETIIDIITKVSENLTKNNYMFILVVPPLVHLGEGTFGSVFGREQFLQLLPFVSYFNIMTYDFHSDEKFAPLSPITWIEKSIEYISPSEDIEERSKILMGINMFGRYLGNEGHVINGKKLIEYLKKCDYHNSEIIWEETTGEHYFRLQMEDGEILFTYPTIKSINTRLELAETLKTNVAFWELGQGLQYFFNYL